MTHFETSRRTRLIAKVGRELSNNDTELTLGMIYGLIAIVQGPELAPFS
jgi:hypothetical protein